MQGNVDCFVAVQKQRTVARVVLVHRNEFRGADTAAASAEALIGRHDQLLIFGFAIIHKIMRPHHYHMVTKLTRR